MKVHQGESRHFCDDPVCPDPRLEAFHLPLLRDGLTVGSISVAQVASGWRGFAGGGPLGGFSGEGVVAPRLRGRSMI